MPISTSRLGDAAQPVAEFGDEQFGGIGVDDLVHRRHDAHAHQRLDHIDAALGHAVGQFLHGDRFRDHDLAHDLRLVLAQHALALAFAGAAHRGEAAHALAFLVGGQRAGNGHLAGAAARLVAARRNQRPARRRGAARTTGLSRGLFLFLGRHRDLAGGGQRRDLGGGGLAGALGDLAAGFFFLAAGLLVLGALLRFSSSAALAALFFLDPAAGLFLGLVAGLGGGSLIFLAPAVGLGEGVAAARFVVGLERILHRADAAGALLGGQGSRDRRERPADRFGGCRAASARAGWASRVMRRARGGLAPVRNPA